MAQAEEIRTETGPLDYDYTEKEVELCQENLQNHKACSPDKIKNEMLEYGGTRIVSFLGTSVRHISKQPEHWLEKRSKQWLPSRACFGTVSCGMASSLKSFARSYAQSPAPSWAPPPAVEVVLASLQLCLNPDNTLPFLARYRRDRTGGADSEALEHLLKNYMNWKAVEDRRDKLLATLNKKLGGDFPAALREALLAAPTSAELEDLYLPYKEQKASLELQARRDLLAPLAQAVWQGRAADGWLAGELRRLGTLLPASAPQGHEQDVEAALLDALAMQVAGEPAVRQQLRKLVWDCGAFHVTCKSPPKKQSKASLPSSAASSSSSSQSVFMHYHDWTCSLRRAKPHQILAIERGAKLKKLTVLVRCTARQGLGKPGSQAAQVALLQEVAQIITRCRPATHAQQQHRRQEVYLSQAVEEAWKRLLRPALVKNVRAVLHAQAHEHAADAFARNLRSLLLAPPWRDERVLGLDPGYAHGCKLAAVDEQGQVLETTVMHLQPAAQAQTLLRAMLRRHAISLVALGNGSGARHVEQQVLAHVLAEPPAPRQQKPVRYVRVDESGASVYSTSPLAKAEFPELDPLVVSAISLARRVQDPLSELVKVDPSALGVGLYQKDLKLKTLSDRLEGVISQAVSEVGCDVNSASVSLLSRVPGMSSKTATAVHKHARAHRLRSRLELLQVKGVGPKTFAQAAGFLRISDGDCPMDDTNVHPESYGLARALLRAAHLQEAQLGSQQAQRQLQALSQAKLTALAQQHNVGMLTVEDVRLFLSQPGRAADPRTGALDPGRTAPLCLEQLRPGQQLLGTVRNVVAFGAFVDIGVGVDGLLHESQISASDSAQLSVGSVLRCVILQLDLARRRVNLAPLRQPSPVLSSSSSSRFSKVFSCSSSSSSSKSKKRNSSSASKSKKRRSWGEEK
eukprot:g53816.t1